MILSRVFIRCFTLLTVISMCLASLNVPVLFAQEARQDEGQFSYSIDESLIPPVETVPGHESPAPRMVGSMISPTGERHEMVMNEVIFHPKDTKEIEEFLSRYEGVILHDGTPTLLPENQKEGELPASSGSYLIQINSDTSELDDFELNMNNTGARGHFVFSSEHMARLFALLAREFGRGISPNMLVYPVTSPEHPDNSGGFLDAETWWWMTEDDDPSTPGEDGLSVGVTHAWQYIQLQGLPPSGPWTPPYIAIIDSGYALDQTTGAPLNNNQDYDFPLLTQIDLVDYDGLVGGASSIPCSGGSSCPWHGTGAFGVSLARHSNQYGGAGTSGNIARAMLIRYDGTFFSVADGIVTAALNGASVISLSLGGGCDVWEWVCTLPPDDFKTTLQNAVWLANTYGAVVLAAAGNDGVDLATKQVYPCELDGVICVGSVNQAKNNVYNFGPTVDIWAPTSVYSTVSPLSAMTDADTVGADELYLFGGTSASTPFVAGIVAMMKALNPGMYWDQVQSILQSTANPSPDARVSKGYVDAFRAVKALGTDSPPTIQITYPANGATVSYDPLNFRAAANDPDTSDPNAGIVEMFSNQQGLLCTVNGFYYADVSGCDVPFLNLGTHVITAVATDIFGDTASDMITINVVNSAPTADIGSPAEGATFYSNQQVTFSAYVNDVDENPPFPDTQVAWSSNIDGMLGTGWSVTTALTPGTHTVTVVATDSMGLTGQDSITVNIVSGAGVPTVQIVQPTESYFGPGTVINFQATATDPEDGTLSGNSLQWESSVDGFLSTGNSFSTTLTGPSSCSPETVTHTISLYVTDSDGNQVIETKQITIGIVC